ncbi:oligosaccharide flippase family protein [Ancylomarina sp. DW003]|nr:oligosaccharide flippase family protein [Ancylomarina sp. DW003]MDE5421911.1 oligosaccharide flippase family protein [Ancylomarina sp. DW003]
MLDFLKAFYRRKGHLIFSSTIITKLIGLLISVFVVRFISKNEFGLVTYARTIIYFLTPFVGFGLNHSLLRYGSISQGISEKKQLFYFTLKYGLVYSIFLMICVIMFSRILTWNISEANSYLVILSLSLVSQMVYLSLNNYFRIVNLNAAYSKSNVVYSISSLALSIVLVYFFNGIGFIISLVLCPLIVYILMYKSRILKDIRQVINIHVDKVYKQKMLKYGLFIGFGSIASQLTLMTDNLVIANIIQNPDSLAVYRTGILIPFNLMFIPMVFMTSDFVKIAKESHNLVFLKNYLNNYFKIFLIISILLAAFLYFGSEFIVTFVFGEKYIESAQILRILSIGLIGAFVLRIPSGNILNALGKAKWNVYNSYFMVISNFGLSIYLTMHYGIIGTAVATSIMFWLSGIIGVGLLVYYITHIETCAEVK